MKQLLSKLKSPTSNLFLAMATINTLSSLHCSHPCFRLHSSQNAPYLSLYLNPIPFLASFPSISLKPNSLVKPRALVIVSALKSLSETNLVTVPESSDDFSSSLPSESGVYAVFDQNGDLQFVGISRNIAASIIGHRKSIPELCSSVKVHAYFGFVCV